VAFCVVFVGVCSVLFCGYLGVCFVLWVWEKMLFASKSDQFSQTLKRKSDLKPSTYHHLLLGLAHTSTTEETILQQN
jgi:hypothetical protein